MRRHWHMRSALVLILASAMAAALIVGAGQALSQSGCRQVSGHLEVAVGDEGARGRLTGGISGDYVYTFEGVVLSANNPDVVYVEGRSAVTGKTGTIRFIENSAAAPGSETGTNNATLMTVESGTGAWEGSSGHIAIRGYFHGSTLSGRFDYRGEVCQAHS